MKKILFFLVALLPVDYSKNTICKRLSYQRLATNCLEDIIRNQFRPQHQTALVTILAGQNLDSPIGEIVDSIINKIQTASPRFIFATISRDLILEVYNGKIRQKFKTAFYLITLDDSFEIEEILGNIQRMQTFNPYAVCLIYMETDLEQKEKRVQSILYKFLKARFQYAAILVHENRDLFNLYTFNYTTVSRKQCEAHPVLHIMDQCFNGKMRNSSKIYFEKEEITDFSNCAINVVAKPYPPFVINNQEGFEIDLLKIIGKNLNIRFKINVREKGDWKSKINGSYVELLKPIYERKYLGIGNLGYGTITDNEIEFSFSYHVESLVLVVPAAPDVPRWRILTVIFTIEMWEVCIATIIFFGITFYLTRKFEKGASRNPFLTSFQVSITQPVNKFPNTDLNRILFVALSILSIILSSAYTCILMKNLKNPPKEHQISTLKELFQLSLEYKYGGLSLYKELFSSGGEIQEMIYQNFQTAREENDTVKYWLKEVAENRALWTLSSENYVKFSLANDNNFTTDDMGQPKVYILKTKWSSYPLSIVARKGYFVMKPINNILNKMLLSGLVEYSWRKYKTKILQGESKDSRDDGPPFEPLSLQHLEGAFVMLIFGYGFGLLALGIEILIEKTHLIKKIYRVKRIVFRKIKKR